MWVRPVVQENWSLEIVEAERHECMAANPEMLLLECAGDYATKKENGKANFLELRPDPTRLEASYSSGFTA